MIPAKTAWGSAVGTGITGPYSIPFPLYSQSFLTVLFFVNDVSTVKLLGTDYTFSAWAPDGKGQVASPQITFTVAVPQGTLIVFLLTMPGTQNTQFTNFNRFFPAAHESEMDQLCQNIDQLIEWAGKTAKAPDYEFAGQTSQTMPSIADRAGKVAGWDLSGNLAALLAVPAGSVVFTSTGQLLAGIASLAALLAELGIFIVANQAGLAGLSPIANALNLAFEQDTSDLWIYNFQGAAWYKIGQALP